MNDRLAQLKLDAYRRYTSNPTSPKVVNWNKAFFELYADLPLVERQARTVAYSLENEPVYIHPLERTPSPSSSAYPLVELTCAFSPPAYVGWRALCVFGKHVGRR